MKVGVEGECDDDLVPIVWRMEMWSKMLLPALSRAGEHAETQSTRVNETQPTEHAARRIARAPALPVLRCKCRISFRNF